MTIIQTSEFIVPSDPAILKKIRDVMFELSGSMYRIESEKDLIKEGITALSDDVEIPKKHLNKMLRLYHRQNAAEVSHEQDAVDGLYAKVFDTNKE